jgi:DNA-binding MltR family transcriptional regulator
MEHQVSNREALRKLSRKFPAPPEIERIMNDLRGEKDISVAIVASAITEASLEKLITQKFKTKRPALVGQIFHNRGPLADFHSKILIANAFQIITSNMAEELHSIKTIRNTFAHTKVPISFDHELIAREISSLKMLTAIKNVEKETAQKLELENKAWFLLITKIILVMFEELGEHVGTADEAIKDALDRDAQKRSASP